MQAFGESIVSQLLDSLVVAQFSLPFMFFVFFCNALLHAIEYKIVKRLCALESALAKNARFVDHTGHSLTSASVPKSRKPKFELRLKIIDLNNVPLVSGTCYVKWHLPHSASAEHRGKTHKAPIKDHKVVWDYDRTVNLRVIVDKDGLLQETAISFEIIQEYASGPRAERITLGVVHVNLSEYVEASQDTEDGIVRRYLMQESKINSTLKLAINMTQVEGEKNFDAPPLKAAPLFSGIAGIMSVEQAEKEDRSFPTASFKFSRDDGELQDLYRRTLTASYSASGQDLPADECIEDIFAGGDGWGRKANKVTFQFHQPHQDADSDEGSYSPNKLQVPKFSSGTSRAQKGSIGRKAEDHRKSAGKHRGPPSPVIDQNANSSSSEEQKNLDHGNRHEVSEFELREDLRSWRISPE